MGKKGNKRKTRWRVLPIGGDNGDSLCSTNDEEGDGDRVSSSPTTPVNGSWSNGRPAFSPRGPAKPGKHRLGYQQSFRQTSQRGGYNDSKPPLVTTEKKTFNEEEYTKITTPRQDVLFKKGYLGRKKPALTNASNSADANATPHTEAPPMENAGIADHEQTEPPETPHFLYTNGYVDQGGVYYINGGSYELYDPYTGNVTVVVGPAPHGPPVLAAVSCQPVPLQPLEWFNPAFHSYVSTACPGRRKRSSTDSQNWSPQSSESTDPPGSPQEGEEMGLQNGSVEPIEDCTIYQHTHQPPAYVYPGYMFGPAVYNMNGINIQGLPPQPQSIDISGSKRRKKKRRRRRRRGGVDDGSDGSTTDENDLEEPVSVTSQDSSQELESDSKTSAESASCKVENGENEKTEQSVATLTTKDSVTSPEKKTQISSEVTDSSGIDLEATVDECSKPLTSYGSEDNHEIPTTNSYASKVSAETVNQLHEYQDINDTPPLSSINGAFLNKNSCDEIVLNGPTKSENLSLTKNNITNSDGCLIKNNFNQNSTEGLVVTNAVATKEKGKGRKGSKTNKQKQQQNNRIDCSEEQLTSPHLQSPAQKMDGNENVKSHGSNNHKEENEAKLKAKSLSYHADQAEPSDVTRVPSSGDTSVSSEKQVFNELPKKPLRKDHQPQKQQKQVQKKSLSQKERKERGNGSKLSKQLHYSPKDISETSAIGRENATSKPGEHENQQSPGTEICAKVSETSEHHKLSTVSRVSSLHSEENRSLAQNIKKANECLKDEENKACSGDSAVTVSRFILEHSTTVDAHLCESLSKIEDRNLIMNVTHRAGYTSEVADKISKESEKFVDSMEERHSPPPIPPPRRKKWNPCNKRSSTERPPTPGRDLEDRRSSEVLTDDSSSTSTSTSRESEESVIEIISSTRNLNVAGSGTMRQPSEGEQRIISGVTNFFNIVSPCELHTADLETKFIADKHDFLHDSISTGQSNSSVESQFTKEREISSDICPQLSDAFKVENIPYFPPNDDIQQITGSSLENQFSLDFKSKTSNDLSTKISNSKLYLPAVEMFAKEMAHRVIRKALLTINDEKPEQILARPITEAVTKWLRSQSTEEVLTIPELCDSENDSIEDNDEQNMKPTQENLAGSKNVLRNPLPASSHKCKSTNDDAGTRVATNNDDFKISLNKDCVSMTGVLIIDNKLHDMNNNDKCITNTLKEAHTGCNHIQQLHKDEYNTSSRTKLCYSFPLEDGTLNVINNSKDTNHNSFLDAEATFSALQDYPDSNIMDESVEYDADWECEPIMLKPSPLISSLYSIESNDNIESPDDRCLHMCDPALSVAKYYRLGPPTEKVDSLSQDQMSNIYTESEEEIDSPEHFRNELYDSAYDSSHRSLADELEFCEKPLPESWSIDHIKISKESMDVTHGTFTVKYDDYKASDSGIQSEESSNEDSRKPSSNSSNIFENPPKFFNRKSVIHMTGITGDGPFPCGGICCILQ